MLISGKVTFLNHDGATWVFREKGPYKGTYKFGPIKIGNNCFIGFGATILPNVTVGDDCIIAAGSMVTKSVPAGEVWGGCRLILLLKRKTMPRNVMKIGYRMILC